MTKKTKKPPAVPAASSTSAAAAKPRHIAVVGAGIAGITCARTLMQAGHTVTVFEKSRSAGGRMCCRHTEFGGFDHGAQYFTVRDARFALALSTSPSVVRPWSANAVRILDEAGRVVAAAKPALEAHYVAAPGMNALVKHWSQPLIDEDQLLFETQVSRIEPDKLYPHKWQLQTEGANGTSHVYSGFDDVVLAVPSVQAQALLTRSQQAKTLVTAIAKVTVAPCWTLMLAFPQAQQPNLLGPQWNAARSTHHRIAWLARESSKPKRSPIERWTVNASPEWSAKHLEDTAERVTAKLLRAFTEITGIRATPPHATVHRWRYAQTVDPLGQPYAWDPKARVGVCGDWCIGHRVEDGFVSGLEMALALA
jgi:hypothetical protein